MTSGQTVDEQRATLVAELAAVTSEYNEATARAAADRMAFGRLAPLRRRIAEITGTLADIEAVMLRAKCADADAAARYAAEKRANERRITLDFATKYEAAGADLQRAIEALGSAYASFEGARLAVRRALWQSGDDDPSRCTRDLDEFILRHLMWTAGLRHLPGIDELPGVLPARTISELCLESCDSVRGAVRYLSEADRT